MIVVAPRIVQATACFVAKSDNTTPGRTIAVRDQQSLSAPQRNGFSLIELVVVLLLMAILASLATTTVRGVMVRQRLARAAELVEQFDTALRHRARGQRQPVDGQFDRGNGRLIVDPQAASIRSFQLPSRVAIDAIRIGRSPAPSRPMRITVDGKGMSASYAVRLVSGDTDRWILVVGGSGQVIHEPDRAAIDSIMEAR